MLSTIRFRAHCKSVLILFAVSMSVLFADQGGRVGRTSTTSAGCGGGCHGSAASTQTSVSMTSGSGSFTVAPGSTTTFTAIVAHATLPAAGVNIAVKTDQTGTVNAGTLTAGTGLRASSGELTHTQPKAMSNGQTSFTFTWTAPTTSGTYYLRAIGNAVNSDGVEGPEDKWNWMPVIAVTVASVSQTISITSPIGAEQWQQGTVHPITWSASGFTQVKIELSSDGGTTFPTVLVSSVSASAGTWNWSIPSSQTALSTYKVRVSNATNSTINATSPQNFSIVSSSSSLASPQLLTPTNLATSIPTAGTVMWSSVSGASSYNLQISSSASFSPVFISQTGITGVSYSYSSLLRNTQYYWRVQAVNASTTSTWSNSYSFTTVSQTATSVPASWAFPTTDENATIIVPTSINPQIDGRSFQNGDAIGVFYTRNGQLQCGGYAVWNGQNMAITAWKDDETTTLKDGFAGGETFTFRCWDGQAAREYPMNVTYASGLSSFEDNGISILGSLQVLTSDTQKIYIPQQSWRLISSYIAPNDSTLPSVFSSISANFRLLKNTSGQIYYPATSVNQIGNWSFRQGYRAYMNSSDTLKIIGKKIVPEQTPIPITELTWRIIPYLRTTALDITTALSSVNSAVRIVKNSAGQVYFPQYSINQIGQMKPGEGYRIYLNSAASLLYPANPTGRTVLTDGAQLNEDKPFHFQASALENPESAATVIVFVPAEVECSEIALLDEQGAVLASSVRGQRATVLLCDATHTRLADVRLIGWDAQRHRQISLKSQEIRNELAEASTYQSDNFDDVLRAESVYSVKVTSIEERFSEIEVRPQPAENSAVISVVSEEECRGSLEILSLQGITTLSLSDIALHKGANILKLDCRSLATGKYICQVKFAGTVLHTFVTILR